MESKICKRCKLLKSFSEFREDVRYSGGYVPNCRKCVYKRTKYLFNLKSLTERKKIRTASYESAKKSIEKRNFEIYKLFLTGCKDCGIRDFKVLEFDHVFGKKLYDIAKLRVTGSNTKLKTELKKCEVVCANCHKIRTFSREACWRTL